MSPKNLYRLLFLGLLAFLAWTCNVNDVGPDTLSFSVPDTLKYPNYDSIQLHVFVIPTSKDTTFRKVAFHGRYDSAAQLKKLVLGKMPSHTFTVVVKAFRNKVAALIIGANFTDGKIGKIDTILLPTDTTRRVNHRPVLSLVSPDNGKTVFAVNEGATLSFSLAVKDTDVGDAGSLQPLPGSYCGPMTLDTATKSFSFKPAYTCIDSSGDSLVYKLEFIAKDRGIPVLSDTLKIKIVVQDKETAPRWKKTLPTVSGKEGSLMSLALDSLYLGDDEEDSVSFSASQGTLSTSPLTWSFKPGFSQAGEDTVFVIATDNHKPPLSSKFAIRLMIADSIRPLDVVITYPPNGFITRNSQVVVSWKVNGTAQTTQLSDSLPFEGQNLVSRFYRDTSTGDTASDRVQVIRDQTPPSKPVVTGPGLTNNSRPKWVWRSGGGGNGSFRYKLDDRNLAEDTVGAKDMSYVPAAKITEGSHWLYVQECDAAGNWSAMDSASATIDTTNPVVKITSPQNGFVTRFDSVEVLYTVDTVTQPKTTRKLTLGSNILWVFGQDLAGNRDSASVTVIRDSTQSVLTTFGFTSPLVTGVINESAKTIRVTVPYGTTVTALVAVFSTTGASVRVGSTPQISGITANNFSAPIIYTVVAANGSTQDYTVTLNTYNYLVTFDGQSADTLPNPLTKNVPCPATTVGTLPTPPIKRGYAFAGWFTQTMGGGNAFTVSTPVTGDLVVYAKWTAIAYNIVYVLNSGTNDAGNPTSYTIASSTLTLQPATRVGSTFDGWYSEASFTNRILTIPSGSTGDKTFYAKWTATVTYDGNGHNGGSLPAAQTTAVGLSVTLASATVTKTGYTFASWNTNVAGTGTSYVAGASFPVNANITLYAKWTTLNYSIAYFLNGGINNAGNPTSYTIQSPLISLLSPTKSGYVFDGWYSDLALTQPSSTIPAGSTGNKSFYAKWVIKDVDGNIYTSVLINGKTWMVGNLKTTKYKDNTNIPLQTVDATWGTLTTAAYCWYGNDITNKNDYGALYNWNAVNTGKLAPEGWHVATKAELDAMGASLASNYPNSFNGAGYPLKETGNVHWDPPNNSTNTTGFTALGGGERAATNGAFSGLKRTGHWWLSDGATSTNSWSFTMVMNDSGLYPVSMDLNGGYNVRCVLNP